MAVTKIKPIKGTLNKALDYIQNPAKTDEKMLVSSFGCSYETADIEFTFTLSQALDKGNNLAHHLIQAFEPGEVDYREAHEIGRQLADAVTKGQHEYVLTTHIDKGHSRPSFRLSKPLRIASFSIEEIQRRVKGFLQPA